MGVLTSSKELLRSKRVAISLDGDGIEPLAWMEADTLCAMIADVLGALAVDVVVREDPARLGVCKDLFSKYTLWPSLAARPELAQQVSAVDLRQSGVRDLLLLPEAPPAKDLGAVIKAVNLPWRLRLDTWLGQEAVVAWIDAAVALGAEHLELRADATAEPSDRMPLSWLPAVLAHLEQQDLNWCVHGAPHCLLTRRARAFSSWQTGYCLYDYAPEWQQQVDALVCLPSGARQSELARIIRERNRLQSTIAHKTLNRFLRTAGWSSRATRYVHRLRHPAGVVFRALRPPSHEQSVGSGHDATAQPKHSAPCERCAINRLCPGPGQCSEGAIDDSMLSPVQGAMADDPLAQLKAHGQVMPLLDQPRRSTAKPELAQRAREHTCQVGLAEEISSSSYRVCDTPFDKMNGSVNWLPLWDRFCDSSILRPASGPMTVSATFFGTASFVGFSFGHNLQVMCRPTSDRHRLTVHVDKTGDYVLLCDDAEVEAVDVPGKVNRAGRLPERLEPRLAAYGIDQNLITQEVLVWTGATAATVQLRPEGEVDLSVIVVCTKYSRRLTQLMRSIAGQQQFDLSRAEIVVAYVPGLDGTEDILECLATLWPELGMVRVPFDDTYMHAKGFMINQSVTRASGRRVLITDADIILPPDTFARLECEFQDDHFVSVSGRKMLDAKTTAELLMGIRDPVHDFHYLRNETSGEMRLGEAKGTPIGYFQCVLRSHFRKVPYEELPHFEGADMRFSQDIRQAFGKETTMENTVVLHQDHAGSRWFGTKRQF